MALPAGRRGVRPDQVNPDGSLNVEITPYSLPTASAETKGGVKIGEGLTMEGEVLKVASSGGLSVKYSTSFPATNTTVPAGQHVVLTASITQTSADKSKNYINVVSFKKQDASGSVTHKDVLYSCTTGNYYSAGGNSVTWHIVVYNPTSADIVIGANRMQLDLLG